MNFNKTIAFVNLIFWIIIGLFHIREETVPRIHYLICWLVVILEGLNLLLIMNNQ